MIQEYSVDITVAAICPKIFVNGIDEYIRICCSVKDSVTPPHTAAETAECGK